jgi:hypothetical protein
MASLSSRRYKSPDLRLKDLMRASVAATAPAPASAPHHLRRWLQPLPLPQLRHRRMKKMILGYPILQCMIFNPFLFEKFGEFQRMNKTFGCSNS